MGGDAVLGKQPGKGREDGPFERWVRLLLLVTQVVRAAQWLWNFLNRHWER